MKSSGKLSQICHAALCAATLIGCGSDQGLRSGRMTEGDTGFFHRGATECYGNDANPVVGSNVWVGPDGSDSNSGVAEDQPLATLAHALCNLAPGQTLHILQGFYESSVILAAFGDADAPITIRGVKTSDGRPVLDGGRSLTMGVAVVESRNFVIEGLEFRNYTDEGLFVALTDDVEIRDCVFADNGFDSIEPDNDHEGFGINVADVGRIAIDGCVAVRNGPGKVILQTGVLGTGINTFSIADATITNNLVADNKGGGILIEDGFNVRVTGNEIRGNQLDAAGDYWDGGIWIDGGVDILVESNNIHHNLGPAIQISDDDLKYPFFSCRQVVRGNTLTDNFWAIYLYNWGVCPMPEIETILDYSGNTVSNNVYPGSNAEDVESTFEGDILCKEFPCGKNTPCTGDDFDHSVEHCSE